MVPAAVQIVAAPITPEPTPPPALEPREEELFDDLDDVPSAELSLFDTSSPAVAPRPVLPQTIADADLEDEARRELSRLLNAAIDLPERAMLLVKLAHHTDTKRAPVALRAIAEINALTGVTRERPADTMPMFQLPSDSSVSIVVAKVVQ